MKCPIDSTMLQITERQGIEIDYCPQCRGIWLDRGELDKLIDKSQQYNEQPQASHHRNEDHHQSRDQYNHHPKKKKENFLSDLFEFGD